MTGFCFATLLVLTISAARLATADYTFSVQIWSFSNPQEHLANGTCCICCEDQNTTLCPSACNSVISFCLRDIDHPSADTASCPIAEITTNSTEAQVLNTTTVTGPWEGSIQLYISIVDDIRSTLETPPGDRLIAALIDLILLDHLNVSSPGPITMETTYVGLFGRVSLQIGFGVFCAGGFFGSDCGTFCEAHNGSQGHFTCNQTDGARVCLEGYRGVEGNCTECIPQEGCSAEGGFCTQPGECVCRAGFSGTNCTQEEVVEPSVSLSSVATLGGQLVSSLVPISTPMPTARLREGTSLQAAPSSVLVSSPPGMAGVSSSAETFLMTSTVPEVPNTQPTLLENSAQVVIIAVAACIGGLLVISAVIFVIILTTKCTKGQEKLKEQRASTFSNSIIFNANSVEVEVDLTDSNGQQPKKRKQGDTIKSSLDTSTEALQNPTYRTFRDSGLYTQENEEVVILPNPNTSDEVDKRTDPEDMLGAELNFESSMEMFDSFSSGTAGWLNKKHSISHTDLSINSDSMEMEGIAVETNGSDDKSMSFIYADEVAPS